eukprot:7258939-Alexandrium_andersonii.AAC.1
MAGALQDSSGCLLCWFDHLRREDLGRYQALTGHPEFNTLCPGCLDQPPGVENTVRSQNTSV